MITDILTTNLLQTLTAMLPWTAIILCGIFIIPLVIIGILKILDIRHLFKQKIVFLELTPPSGADKAPEATQHLFSVLHGMEASRSILNKFLRRSVTFSLEVVSTKEQGIRYVIGVADENASNVEKTIVSYLSDVRIRRIDNFLTNNTDPKSTQVLEFKQTDHFAYPLQTNGSLQEIDPIAYLTGVMTNLSPEETIVFQIIATPTKIREARTISRRLLNNEELLDRLGKHNFPIAGNIFTAINSILFSIVDSIGDMSNSTSSYNRNSVTTQSDVRHKQEVAMKIKPARTLSIFEQELAESVHRKLCQPLYKVSIRALVIANNERKGQLTKAIRDSLSSFDTPGYQSLKTKHKFPHIIKNSLWTFTFRARLPSLFLRGIVLSASEIAGLYHFPHSETAKIDNVIKSLSKTLPAPISLKGNPNLDILIGRNYHHGTLTDIGLTAAERERHAYIIGGTGNGKTTLLQYAAVQDIRGGKGLAVIDPHGDLAETLLRYVPDERINDVIYFNPDDLSHPIGLNLLELTPDLADDELLREKDLVAESVVSIFRKIFSDDDSGGHRIEYVLRNTIHTALTVENATLFTIYDLLNDPKYRKGVVNKLESKDLKNFWNNEMGKAGGMQQVKMVAGITAKVGRFLFSASAKRILEQPRSTIDFDDILNGKILICNFSKGLLGEDASELFGIAVLAKLQIAVLRRARMKQTDRRPFYLYVDEFQNFATTSFVQMLSEARKYKLFLTMAEQSTSQQDDQQMVNIILANVGTIICFRSGNPADEQLVLPLFSPYIEKGEIANLPSYNFYMRISALKTQEPFSGETVLLEDDGDEAIAKEIVVTSRKNYAIEYVPPKAQEINKPNFVKEKPTAIARRRVGMRAKIPRHTDR